MNNQQLFLNLIHNKYLRTKIFSKVNEIHTITFKLDSYKWSELIDIPKLLVYYNCTEQVRQHFQQFKINSNSFTKPKEISYIRNILLTAVIGGSLSIIRYLIEDLHFDEKLILLDNYIDKTVWNNHDLVYYASKYGKLNCLEYLLQKFPNHTWNYDSAFVVSPMSHNLEIMTILSGYIDFEKIIVHQDEYNTLYENAAFEGRIEIIQWLINKRPAVDIPHQHNIKFYIGAFRGRRHNVIEYLIENYDGFAVEQNLSNLIIEGIISLRRIDLLRDCYKRGIGEYRSNALHKAFQNIEIMKYVYEIDKSLTPHRNTIDSAAMIGNLDVIKWIHITFPGIECATSGAIDYAAINGHLETIKWLHENRTEGCTSIAMDNAAANGHLESVQWLHSNRTEGCSTNAIDRAAKNNHLEVVKWLTFNRPEKCTIDAMNDAALAGHIEMLKFLHENREEGCNKVAMDRSNNMEIVKWLHENRTEGCTIGAIVDAINKCNLEKLQWLKDNYQETFKRISQVREFKEYNRKHLEVFEWLLKYYREDVFIKFSSLTTYYSDTNIYMELINNKN